MGSSLLFDLEQNKTNEKTSSAVKKTNVNTIPLAARIRPSSFSEYIGQKHILSEDKLLKKSIDNDTFSSLILFGPPGIGKTSLAELIAKVTDSVFIRLSGVTLKVADLRKEISEAVFRRDVNGKRTVIFVDEIHRFNRAQQDSLLPDIENGNIRFIGATTQNPYFYIISPLLSRSMVFRLEPLSVEEIKQLILRAVKSDKGFGEFNIEVSEEALNFWAEICDGDGRRALNALEIAVSTAGTGIGDEKIRIGLNEAEASIQQKSLSYGEDEHYDTISAFIKSMRGSDPDAALYWMAKMLNAGEDIMFIARRIVIFASEDIGNADPRAVQLAVSVMKGVEMIGMPEARILLAQAATYCATSPKSNAAYSGIEEAMSDVKSNRTQTVPVYLKSAYCKSTNEAVKEKYKYPHNTKEKIADQKYMGVNKNYYRPEGLGYEKRINERLEYWESIRNRDEN
ncbi:MAG: replication-associated recombination protein A [Victivallales bacterium]|nr:replication-associated recombination protein A [Victivallales bacterium]MCF7889426.1 replication-associated recombination protein A [Victivallales bacterium]